MSLKDNYNKDNFTVVIQPFFSGTGIPKTVTKDFYAYGCQQHRVSLLTREFYHSQDNFPIAQISHVPFNKL